MHLLFISSLLPDHEPSTGFEIATSAIVEGYRRQGIKVTPVGFRRAGSSPARKGEIDLGEIVLENAAASKGRKAAWVCRALLKGLPISAAKVSGLSKSALSEKLRAAGPIDGIVVNSIQMPTAYPWLVSMAPSIFVAHNVEHHSARQNAEAVAHPHTRLLYDREARLLERAEATLCSRVDVVHTLSEDDRAGLGLASDPRCLPVALAVGRSATSHDDGRRDHDIGLIGTWSWAPNRTGLDWFLHEVVPHLPSDLSVAIAGRMDGDPPEALDNVEFLGRVDSAQDFVRSCRTLALATRGGTGVQLKTLEAFEEGLPAVATRSALRGVDTVPANIRVADDAMEFAAALSASVLAEREGRTQRLDGTGFAASQRAALDSALAAGVAKLSAAAGRGARRAGEAAGSSHGEGGRPLGNRLAADAK